MKIGIVGQGFVGTAVFEGFRHAVDICAYDSAHGWKFAAGGKLSGSHDFSYVRKPALQFLVEQVDGPIFVCVPTPMAADGACDVSIVESVVRDLDFAAFTSEKRISVAIKSTVLPGTTSRLSSRFPRLAICFNPEFLREANHIEDFGNQDRIILGGSHAAREALVEVYRRAFPGVPIVETESCVAEMAKYVTNCFLATKVSFANEIYGLCSRLGVSYDSVVECAALDSRLGTSHWAVPGPDGRFGFGGTCFPKDMSAILRLASQVGVECNTISGAWRTNETVRPTDKPRMPEWLEKQFEISERTINGWTPAKQQAARVSES